MSGWTEPLLEEALKKVSERSMKDAAFRELCKRDINLAINEVIGKEIPTGLKINVIDNTGYHLSVILPQLEKRDDELTDNELASAAGGLFSYRGRIVDANNGPVQVEHWRL